MRGCATITFLFVDQSSPFFSANVGGVVVDQILFRFSSGRSVREIFAIKFESCLKSHRILPSQILGDGPSPKVVSTLTPLPRGTSRGNVW